MNIAMFLGFICGLGLAALLIWAASKRLNTDGKRKTEYDERQKTIRGVGYMYGFYTLMIYLGVMMAIDFLGVELPVTNTILYFTGIFIAGLVLCWYCIMHDAYWGMNNNVKTYTIFLMVIGGINLLFGIMDIVSGSMVVNGVLRNSFVNLECGILMAGIGVMLLIKNRRDKREESEM